MGKYISKIKLKEIYLNKFVLHSFVCNVQLAQSVTTIPNRQNRLQSIVL